MQVIAAAHLQFNQSKSEIRQDNTAKQKSLNDLITHPECFSISNEASAWSLVLEIVEEALELYPTTFEQDFEILETDDA